MTIGLPIPTQVSSMLVVSLGSSLDRSVKGRGAKEEASRVSGGGHQWSAGSNDVLIATEEVIWSHYGAPVGS
jgi:hypothetical protein